MRYDVGLPPRDLEPRDPLAGLSFRMIWSPIAMQRPDGSRYGLFLHYQIVQGPGFTYKQVVMGGVEHADGTVERFVDLEPDLRFDPANRRLQGGTIEARTADGNVRTLELEVVSDTGFHLGAGLYFGLDGHHHGEWRGDLSSRASTSRTAPTRWWPGACTRSATRSCTSPTRVGGGEGWGNCQPIITGGDDALGLSADDSFM